MPRYALMWAPDGHQIAVVDAPTERAALRQTPAPWKTYLGEVYVLDLDLNETPQDDRPRRP